MWGCSSSPALKHPRLLSASLILAGLFWEWITNGGERDGLMLILSVEWIVVLYLLSTGDRSPSHAELSPPLLGRQ